MTGKATTGFDKQEILDELLQIELYNRMDCKEPKAVNVNYWKERQILQTHYEILLASKMLGIIEAFY